ncbi:MAG: condensation domain-containing protein, partial [Pseudomonadota bacterium]
MTSTTEKQTYPLTSSQREFWFRQKQHPNLPMYNIGGYLDIPGEIDTNVFNEAVNLLIQKHDNLRTRLLATKNDIEA